MSYTVTELKATRDSKVNLYLAQVEKTKQLKDKLPVIANFLVDGNNCSWKKTSGGLRCKSASFFGLSINDIIKDYEACKNTGTCGTKKSEYKTLISTGSGSIAESETLEKTLKQSADNAQYEYDQALGQSLQESYVGINQELGKNIASTSTQTNISTIVIAVVVLFVAFIVIKIVL